MGALQCLHHLLSSPKKSIIKETCWTISNITAGLPEQLNSVINARIIPALINLMSHPHIEIRKESGWAVSNATSGGTREQIQYFVQQGALQPLVEMLGESDVKVINVALDALEHILSKGVLATSRDNVIPDNEYIDTISALYGLEKLDVLQDHQDQEIYEKSLHIIETYFGTEDEEEYLGADQQQFGVPQPGFPANQVFGAAPQAGFGAQQAGFGAQQPGMQQPGVQQPGQFNFSGLQ